MEGFIVNGVIKIVYLPSNVHGVKLDCFVEYVIYLFSCRQFNRPVYKYNAFIVFYVKMNLESLQY